MGKKTWVKPMTLVQKFEANETVANNCFLIACESKATSSTGSGSPDNPWGEGEGHYTAYGTGIQTGPNKLPSFKHENCMTASNNIFNINGKHVEFVQEINGKNERVGFEYLNDVDQNGVVSDGDIIYWFTSDIGGKWDSGDRWNHWGHVKAINPDKPCQS